MRRLVPVLALAALSLACSPQNALNSLPTAPTTTTSNPSAAPATGAPNAPAGESALKPLAAGLSLTYEHRASKSGSVTVDTYAVQSVNDTSAVVELNRLYNGKQDAFKLTKTLSRQKSIFWPDFSRLQAGDFAGGYDAAIASAVEESVTVPAGTFKAKKLSMGTSTKLTYWISGTYLLKATSESSSDSTTTELTKIQ